MSVLDNHGGHYSDYQFQCFSTQGITNNSLTWTTHHNEEVHSVNTDSWIVLDSKINVLLDTEAKVTSLREVVFPQLVFLDLEETT